MTLTQAIIEAAYARSSANDPGKTAGDPELIGVANRLFQGLYALAAAASPASYLARTTLTLAAGVATLPTDVIDIRRVQTLGGLQVNVIPVEEISRLWHLPPAIFREGSSIVSRGNPGDPGPSDTLRVWLLGAPATLSALSSVVDARFPVRYHELLILKLALYLDTKDEGRDQAGFVKLKAEHDFHWEAFMRLSGLSLSALQSPHLASIIRLFNASMGGGEK